METLACHTCQICGAELTDPQSIQRGIGPECWAKQTTKHTLDAVQRHLRSLAVGMLRYGVKLTPETTTLNEATGEVTFPLTNHQNFVYDRFNRLLKQSDVMLKNGILYYLNGERVVPQPEPEAETELADIATVLGAIQTRQAYIGHEIRRLTWLEPDDETEEDLETRESLTEEDEVYDRLLHQWRWAKMNAKQTIYPGSAVNPQELQQDVHVIETIIRDVARARQLV